MNIFLKIIIIAVLGSSISGAMDYLALSHEFIFCGIEGLILGILFSFLIN